ncbi:hypothetical protein L916_12015, partial [Phytophthora nicotianae]
GLPRPVEQRLIGTDDAMEQRFTRDDNVVEQRFPREAANVLPGVIGRAAAGEQDETMEPGLQPTVENKLPRVVERALLMTETGESYTPLRDAEDELQRLNSAGMIEHRLSSITLHVRPVVAVGAIRGDPVPYHESQPGPSPNISSSVHRRGDHDIAWSVVEAFPPRPEARGDRTNVHDCSRRVRHDRGSHDFGCLSAPAGCRTQERTRIPVCGAVTTDAAIAQRLDWLERRMDQLEWKNAELRR